MMPIGRRTPCRPGGRDRAQPDLPGVPPKRDVAVPVRSGASPRHWLYTVDCRRVRYEEERSAGGLLLITATLEERRLWLSVVPVWTYRGQVVGRLQDPLDVAVRAFLRSGHVPAEPFV